MSRIFPRTGLLRRLIVSLPLFLLLCGPMSLVTLAFEGNAPAHLQCEGMQEPLGIDIISSPTLVAAPGFQAWRPAGGV